MCSGGAMFDRMELDILLKVPHDKPAEALYMLNRWLAKETF